MLDFDKAVKKQPDVVTSNGYAAQYKDHPLTAKPGQTVRFYVVDAGPSFDTDFHVVGTVLRRVYLDGTTTDGLPDVQTQFVPAGGGMIFDVTFHQKGISLHLPLLRVRRHGRGWPRQRRQRPRHDEPVGIRLRPHPTRDATRPLVSARLHS